MAKFEIGDKVWYSGAWGSQSPIATKITNIGEHKGRVVYDIELHEKIAGQWGSDWGYENQFRLRYVRLN